MLNISILEAHRACNGCEMHAQERNGSICDRVQFQDTVHSVKQWRSHDLSTGVGLFPENCIIVSPFLSFFKKKKKDV